MGHSCIQLEKAVIHVISLVSFLCNPSIYPNHKCWRRWSWMVLWRPIRPSRTNTKKRCSFHHRGLECKNRKSRDTWSNRQVWPWSTEWNRAKVNKVLPREHTADSKHPLPTTQEDSTRGHHQMVDTEIRLIILFTAKDGDALYSQQKQTGSWLWLGSWTPYCQIQTEIEPLDHSSMT